VISSSLPSKRRAHWEDVFDELVELSADERKRRLDKLRLEDGELAGRLERLLAADAAASGFLDAPHPDLFGDDPEDTSEAEPQLAAGTIVGSWRVVSLLGRGGMGEVYLAERHEPAFAQRVALKVIKRGMDSQAIVRRFVRERQILARLDHPNLARLLDGGTSPDGRPYFALELVEGEPITAYCEQRNLDLEGRLRLVQTVCQAVHSAHRRLVVHRDLKPANILVTPDGTPKLLDFGIAKLLAGEEDGQTVTVLGCRVLTPAYAAPEQIRGEPISTATDVYALGVLLYELLTGALPHRRGQRALTELASAVEHETLERPSAVLRRPGHSARLARRVAGDLDLIVLTALHRDPSRRYASAQALANDLGHFLAGRPIRARPDELGYRVRKFLRRHRVPVAAMAAGIVALWAGLALSLWQAHAARLAALRADAEARRAERVKSFLISVFRQSDPETGDGAKLTAGELLERGAANIDTALAGEPQVQADLLDAVTRIETNLGLLAPALAHAQRALALRVAALPPADGRIGLSHVALGQIQDLRGDDGDAKKSFAAALAVLLPAFGADSVEVAAARRGLAGSMQAPGERRQAVELLRLAHATFVRRLGELHVDSAGTLHELAFALEVAQQYKEAEQTYRRSAALLEGSLGPHNVKVAAVQSDLAGLLDRLGRSQEARPLFERAIASQRATLGPHHVNLADTLFSYAVLLIAEQEHAAADRALAEALAIYGPDRYQSGHCWRYLGVSALGQEHFVEAAKLFARAAETYRRIAGDDDEQRWRALANLGWAHYKAGRVAEARAELTTAVKTIERIAGGDSYELRLPLAQLGEVLTAAGEPKAAVDTLERVRALEKKLFGTDEHREVAASELLLARALLARGAAGDAREARRVLDEALGIFARVHPQNVHYAESLLESGRLALAEGDRVRARRDLAAASPMLLARKGPAHAETREAFRLLAIASAGAPRSAAVSPGH
jgi:tetratricopeptide (TPR) repeat protein/tRNA A-37 threonylcarbamoyl transferase component Bud32